jgi:hypothetical protein
LAGQIHPDHNATAPDAADEMTLLTQAHELLSAYASNWAQRRDDSSQSLCCFDRQTVEQTLLIAIRRQELST